MTEHFNFVRIVAAALVMFAAFLSNGLDAESATVSRLSSSLEPLRLDMASQREWRAWSAYARGMFRGFETGRRSQYLAGIEDALLLEPDSDALRGRWGESVSMLRLPQSEACKRFRKIYLAYPQQVETVLFYSKLLRANRSLDKTMKVLRKGVSDTRGLEGRLVRELVMVGIVNGGYRQKSEQDETEQFLWKILNQKELRDVDAVKVSQAYFWLTVSDFLADQLKSKMLGKNEKQTLMRRISALRKKVESRLSEIDVTVTDDENVFLVCAGFDSLRCYDKLLAVLHRLKGTEHQDASWLRHSFKAARATGKYDDLLEFLDRQVFTVDSDDELLMNALQAYLVRPINITRTIEIAGLLVKKHPRDFQHRHLLSYLLYLSGKSVEGLNVLSLIPVDKRSLPSHLLWGHLLVGTGRRQEAYDYLKARQVAFIRSTDRPIVNEYLQALGLLCVELKKIDEGLACFKQGYELQPESPIWCNFYGYMLADLGRQLGLAERLILKALAKEPQSVAYLDSLGWVYFRQGRYNLALETMIKVIGQGGLKGDNTHEIHDHTRQIFEKLGLVHTARLYEFDLE